MTCLVNFARWTPFVTFARWRSQIDLNVQGRWHKGNVQRATMRVLLETSKEINVQSVYIYIYIFASMKYPSTTMPFQTNACNRGAAGHRVAPAALG